MTALIQYGRQLLGKAVRKAWESRLLTRDPDGVFAGVLGAGDIEKLLEAIDTPESGLRSPLDAWGFAPPEAPRLHTLLRMIGAGEIAEDALAIMLAVEIDATARTLAGYLRGNALGVALTVGTLLIALGDDRMSELVVALGVGAPLRRHRFIEMTEKQGELIAGAAVRMAPRLLRWLVDQGQLDREVADFASYYRPTDVSLLSPAALAVVESEVHEIELFLINQRDHDGVPSDLVVRGVGGSGRSEIIREACRRAGAPVLLASMANILSHTAPTDAVVMLLRETLLLDAQLVVTGWDALIGSDEQVQRVRSAFAASSRALVITSTSTEQAKIMPSRGAVLRDIRIPKGHEREAIWRELVPELDAEKIASLYRIGLGSMQRIADGARLRAEVRGDSQLTDDDFTGALRSEFETDLGTVATRLDVTQTWDDLVLSEDTMHTIRELIGQLRHRATVLGRWGFQRKLGKGVGTTALFSGGPGTGKSMVAGLIAKDLGLELYQLDLSRVLSKWVGETEKNLGRVFDAAEVGHVLLLFDEADALMAKRSADVKSANDRYANMETNYILQRLEQFQGVAILTSNLESALDPAMARRISFELRFPFPDVEQRAELWRRMMPSEAPIVGEIDYKMLAERFELAGGHVRNVVLRAAYLAASDGEGTMTQAHLLRAAEYEYRDRGMLVSKGRLTK